MDLPIDVEGTAAQAANVKFDAAVKAGHSLSDAANIGITAGAGAAAVAACAATGVGVAISPLCALAGGAIGKWIANSAGDIVHGVSEFFTGSLWPTVNAGSIITPSDAISDPNGVGGLSIQCAVADYLLIKQLSAAVTTIGRAIQQADGIPDSDKILGTLAGPLGLVPGGGPPGGSRNFYQAVPSATYPPFEFDGDWIVPSFAKRATAVTMQWSSGAISNAQAAAAVKVILQNAVDWSKKCEVETARQVMLLGTDMVLQRAYNLAGSRSVPTSVADAHNYLNPNSSNVAEQLVLIDRLRHGIDYGVQFLIVRDV